jgi:hypothetical protein
VWFPALHLELKALLRDHLYRGHNILTCKVRRAHLFLAKEQSHHRKRADHPDPGERKDYAETF